MTLTPTLELHPWPVIYINCDSLNRKPFIWFPGSLLNRIRKPYAYTNFKRLQCLTIYLNSRFVSPNPNTWTQPWRKQQSGLFIRNKPNLTILTLALQTIAKRRHANDFSRVRKKQVSNARSIMKPKTTAESQLHHTMSVLVRVVQSIYHHHHATWSPILDFVLAIRVTFCRPTKTKIRYSPQ